MTFLDGPLSTTISDNGASMVPGSGSTGLSGNVCGSDCRNPQSSAGVVDSQSVKTTGVGGEERGYDGAKKIKGRKRHLLVDTEGFVLRAKVHSAKVMDWDGIKTLLRQANTQFPRLRHLWLDGG